MYTMPHSPAVILIVDPDALTLTGIAATLDAAGHECHCARDGEAARKAASNLDLDLILCDTQVGRESGLRLCTDLRRRRENYEVPLIFFSDNQSPDLIQLAHDAGGSYFLQKPFDPEVLTELVSKALWMPHLVRTRIGNLPSVEKKQPRRPVSLDRNKKTSDSFSG